MIVKKRIKKCKKDVTKSRQDRLDNNKKKQLLATTDRWNDSKNCGGITSLHSNYQFADGGMKSTMALPSPKQYVFINVSVFYYCAMHVLPKSMPLIVRKWSYKTYCTICTPWQTVCHISSLWQTIVIFKFKFIDWLYNRAVTQCVRSTVYHYYYYYYYYLFVRHIKQPFMCKRIVWLTFVKVTVHEIKRFFWNVGHLRYS